MNQLLINHLQLRRWFKKQNKMELDHNAEIVSSRRGGFGSSDAKLFYKIGSKGIESLSNTDKKRIRVAKGIDEYKSISQNEAMQKGHDFEDWYESNCLSEHNYHREPKLSKQLAKNFDTFFHADFHLPMERVILELKCVQKPDKAKSDYIEQLHWQHIISDCDVYLVACDSTSENFEEGLKPLDLVWIDEKVVKAIKKGIKLLDEAWDTIDLTVGEDWEESDLLLFEQPEVVLMAKYLNEIKSLETQAEEQKQRVLDIMLSNNIKSLKSDHYSITLVPESTTKVFDKRKLFFEHPELSELDYCKTSVRKPYIKVTLK